MLADNDTVPISMWRVELYALPSAVLQFPLLYAVDY